MTGYRSDDLDGFEFKILRATTARFRDPSRLRAILDEESRAGWELVEKFDDYRIRLKRRIEHRAQDRSLEHDPYRTWVGISNNALALTILGVLLALVGLGLAVVAIAR